MARGFLKKSGEGPSIRTITSASAREYTREFLSPSEMQPYEVAEILGSDIDSGLTKSGVARARRKYGGNIIREELSLSFGQSLKKQLLGIHGLLVLLCAVILYIFTPDPLYMLLAVCAARDFGFIDDAELAGVKEITLIHGKGTGALRAGVQAYLRTHPQVKSFRIGAYGEGDAGVTVVTLR
mgnify:CR=1 FL=1